jgi:hypothetical protein
MARQSKDEFLGLDITHTNQQTVSCFNERDFISRSQTVFLCDLQRDNNLPFGINNQSFHCSLTLLISNSRYNRQIIMASHRKHIDQSEETHGMNF